MIKSLPFPTILSVIGLCIVGWCRAFVAAGSMDIVYCILLVPMLSVIFDKRKMVKKIFGILGKHSTNMWLIHAFYTYYFLEATLIVYFTNNVFIDLLILLEMCLLSSLLLNAFWFGLGKLAAKVSERYITYKLSRENKKNLGEKAVSACEKKEVKPSVPQGIVVQTKEMPKTVEEVAATAMVSNVEDTTTKK